MMARGGRYPDEENTGGKNTGEAVSKRTTTSRFRGPSASFRSVERDMETKLTDAGAAEDRIQGLDDRLSEDIRAGVDDGISRRDSPSLSHPPLSPDSMRLPSSRDARDRLFGGFLEEEEEEDGDAEIIIERDGRIRVRPHSQYGGFDFGRPFRRSGPSFLLASERRLRQEQNEISDPALMRELRRERHEREIQPHLSERERALQQEIHQLFLEEEAKLPLYEYRSNRPFAGVETMAQAGSPGASLTSGTSLISSSIGYVIAFVLGFCSILLIASFFCILRAVYVKRKKDAMKKLLKKKRGQDVDFEDEETDPSEESTAKPVPGAEEGWVDVVVEQQVAPPEETMMDVARQDSIQRSASQVEGAATAVVPPEEAAEKGYKGQLKAPEDAAVPTPVSKKEKKKKGEKKGGKKNKDDLKKALSSKHRARR